MSQELTGQLYEKLVIPEGTSFVHDHSAWYSPKKGAKFPAKEPYLFAIETDPTKELKTYWGKDSNHYIYRTKRDLVAVNIGHLTDTFRILSTTATPAKVRATFPYNEKDPSFTGEHYFRKLNGYTGPETYAYDYVDASLIFKAFPEVDALVRTDEVIFGNTYRKFLELSDAQMAEPFDKAKANENRKDRAGKFFKPSRSQVRAFRASVVGRTIAVRLAAKAPAPMPMRDFGKIHLRSARDLSNETVKERLYEPLFVAKGSYFVHDHDERFMGPADAAFPLREPVLFAIAVDPTKKKMETYWGEDMNHYVYRTRRNLLGINLGDKDDTFNMLRKEFGSAKAVKKAFPYNLEDSQFGYEWSLKKEDGYRGRQTFAYDYVDVGIIFASFPTIDILVRRDEVIFGNTYRDFLKLARADLKEYNLDKAKESERHRSVKFYYPTAEEVARFRNSDAGRAIAASIGVDPGTSRRPGVSTSVMRATSSVAAPTEASKARKHREPSKCPPGHEFKTNPDSGRARCVKKRKKLAECPPGKERRLDSRGHRTRCLKKRV